MPAKFYIVWKGRVPGIYQSWDDAKAQIDGFAGAQYASAKTEALAHAALAGGYRDYISAKGAKATQTVIPQSVLRGYAVDASLPAETGMMEYRCVKIDTGEELFKQGPFADATNNIGEFLGIVHALSLFKRSHIDAPLFSDSRTAMAWVRQKHARSALARTERNTALFDLVARAEAWLEAHPYTTQVLKWDTENWGENPADFGRK